MTEDEIREFIRDNERDSGEILTDFVIIAGFIGDDHSGHIVHVSDGTPTYTAHGLIAAAFANFNSGATSGCECDDD